LVRRGAQQAEEPLFVESGRPGNPFKQASVQGRDQGSG